MKEHGKSTRYPAYSAISYVWGKKDDRSRIRCHNGEVKIPPNLRDALFRLRHKRKPIYLWTDSICINQENESEMNGQIQIMGSIYRDSSKVYVWLGEKKEKEAFKLMYYLGKYIRHPHGEFKKKAEAVTDTHQWRSLSRVLKCEWFGRVWTLQELGLNAPHATVFCGPSQIDWSRFHDICHCIKTTCRKLRLQHDLRLYRVTRSAIDFRDGKEGPGFILKLLRTRRCEKDIDRIRGIMGHAFFQKFRNKHHRDFINLADLTSKDMDFQISTELLKLDQPLYTLSLVQQDYKTMASYAHPSWVPRFKHGTFISTLADETKREESWDASGGRNTGSLTPNRNVLQVKGVEVDWIRWQSSTITNDLRERDKNDLVKGIWQQVQKGGPSTDSNKTEEERNRKFLKDFCRVFYLDNHLAGRKGEPVPYPSVEQQMANCLAYFVGSNIEFPSSLRQLRKSLERKNVKGNAEEFFSDTLHHCRSRCFIITSKGHLGLAPEVSHKGENGDRVCILFGGQVPFLLRPGNKDVDEYRLCGECFVLDLMNGEGVSARAKGKTFTLV